MSGGGRRLHPSQRVFWYGILAGLPGSLVALVLLWSGDYAVQVRWVLTALILIFWIAFAAATRSAATHPLRTISNMLAAIREGDYSIRVRGAKRDDPLGELIIEANTLGDIFREQRLGALEATALLGAVMEEIDVAIFAFDQERRLRLVNRAGERLLGAAAERVLDSNASELGLEECLTGASERTIQKAFPGRQGRWGLTRSSFRQNGRPHELLVISDLNRALREEERSAWQRLLRVLGHELNNSLAPISSIAGSLERILACEPLPPDWREDLDSGLKVIASRACSLTRFMQSYSQLARLPAPVLQAIDVAAWVRRAVALETRTPVAIVPGPECEMEADPDQLDQLLVNLVRNAVDACLETGGGVQVSWSRTGNFLEVRVEDEGPGIQNPANLFVPFFTTKPGGSGIGLALSRQIAEAHGGTLTVQNRADRGGCVAAVRLPC